MNLQHDQANLEAFIQRTFNRVPDQHANSGKSNVGETDDSRSEVTGANEEPHGNLSRSENVPVDLSAATGTPLEEDIEYEYDSGDDGDNDDTDVIENELDDDRTVEAEFTAHDLESGSIKEKSVIEKYLLSIHKRIEKDKYPAEYKKKTCWVQPPMGMFGLEDIDVNVDQVYYSRVFLWFPHHLMKKFNLYTELKCPTCDTPLKADGFLKDPPSRRVIDLKE
jgi:hypothetical protein